MHLIIFSLAGILVIAFIFYRYFDYKKSVDNNKYKHRLSVWEALILNANKDDDFHGSAQKIADILSDKKGYGFDYCTLFLINYNRLEILYTNVMDDYVKDVKRHSLKLLKQAEDEGSNAIIDMVCDYPSSNERNIRYLYFIPVRNFKKNIHWALLIEDKDERKLEKIEQGEEYFLKLIINGITMILENYISHKRLEEKSKTDGLTGVYNKAYLLEYISEQIEVFTKNKRQFCFTMFDIDHFKKFNDEHGHLFGDKVLIEVSKFISRMLREGDKIFRYGGEEFCIFMPDISASFAFPRIEEIRNKLSQFNIYKDDGTATRVTCSFGISAFPFDGDDITSLVKASDDCLYESKRNGRNKVTVYADIKSKQRIGE